MFSYNTWGGSWGTSWGNSWGRSAIAQTQESRGGFDERHHRKYREYLERLTKIYEERDNALYAKVAGEVSDIVEELPEAPEIKTIEKVAEKPQAKKVDFKEFYDEIQLVIDYLEKLLEIHTREHDDEEILLMLI